MMLERVTGHACPRCGCEDSRVIRTRNGWGGQFESRSCNHCGKAFVVNVAAEDDKASGGSASVAYVRVACRCPQCGAENPKVVRTIAGGVRYHKCGTCRHTFKSAESE
jgi:transcriptional regulator NrdR family protein